jgi:hypothetical protein
MTEMALIVPSRGRPDNIVRLYEALIKTNADVELVVGTDQDDPKIQQYYDVIANRNISMVVSPERSRFGPTLNSIAKRYADEYEYLAWCGDDHLPITKEWDKRYREELSKMKSGIVYGNDLVQGVNIPTQMAFTSNIVKALGYAVPEGFIHLFIDNFFLELGKRLDGAIYLEDVIVQHLHYSVGNSQQDQTYKEANSPENWSNDQKRFHQYMTEEIDKDVEKIRNYQSIQ